MSKDTSKKKPWNLTFHPRLRAFVEEFVRLNGRSSAIAVIEEALREFFEKRGLRTDVAPEEVLKAVIKNDGGKHVDK